MFSALTIWNLRFDESLSCLPRSLVYSFKSKGFSIEIGQDMAPYLKARASSQKASAPASCAAEQSLYAVVDPEDVCLHVLRVLKRECLRAGPKHAILRLPHNYEVLTGTGGLRYTRKSMIRLTTEASSALG